MYQSPVTAAITNRESVIRSLILAFVFFITMSTHYVFKSAVIAVLIKTFSAFGMPWFDIADAALAGMLILIIFIFRSRSIKISDSLKMITGILCIILIATPFIATLKAQNKLSLIVVGLAGNMIVFVATYSIWMLMISSAFKRSWLTLSILGIGAQAGVLAGATISKHLSETFITTWLPACVGSMYIVIFVLLSSLIKRLSVSGTIPDANPVNDTASVRSNGIIIRELLRGFNPYIKILLLLLLIGSVFGRSVNWLIQQQADYKNTIKLATGFLATFYQSSAILSLGFQLIITPIALRTLSNKWGLFFQPLFALAIMLMMFLKIDTYVQIVLLMLFTSLDFTVYNSFKERLWLPVPLLNKVYHKAIAALLIPKIAAVINGLSILLLAAKNTIAWRAFVIVQVLLWILLVWKTLIKNKAQEQYIIEDTRPSLDAV